MYWKELDVWKKSHELVVKIYKITESFPKEEKFRLVDQICRSAISVPANIVEGQSRRTTKEYLQFLYTARGSVEESKYHLLLAKDLGYMQKETYDQLEEQYSLVGKMLNRFRNRGRVHIFVAKPPNLTHSFSTYWGRQKQNRRFVE